MCLKKITKMDEPIQIIASSPNGKKFDLNKDAIAILEKETRFVFRMSVSTLFAISSFIDPGSV